MGETLLFSNDKGAYTLTDRATWLAQQNKLPGLTVLVGGKNIGENADKDLYNPYGVMAVNPDKFPGVKYDMALNFVKWITSPEEHSSTLMGWSPKLRPSSRMWAHLRSWSHGT